MNLLFGEVSVKLKFSIASYQYIYKYSITILQLSSINKYNYDVIENNREFEI